jgi:tetratricopeptide (TPR) repeat protein
MSSQPAIQYAEFFNQINPSVFHKPPFHPESIKERQEHIHKNDFDDYLALGSLAGLEGDIEAIHKNYQQAIAVSSARHADILTLYAKCLTPFGLFAQAAELMSQAYYFSHHLDFLADAIQFYGLAGRFHQVADLLKTWEQVSPNKTHPFSNDALKIMAFMDEQQVSDDDLQGLIDLAMSILRQNQLTVVPEQIEVDLYADESSQWFHYGILLHESVEKVVKMDAELADKTVEECPSQIIKGGFVPLFKAMEEE